MITAKTLIDRSTRLVSGPVHDLLGGGLAVSNMAGRWCMARRQWGWSIREAVLTAVPGASRIYLPEDFGGMMGGSGQILSQLVKAPPRTLADYRENVTSAAPGCYFYYVAMVENEDGSIVPAMEVYPAIPTTAVLSIGRVVYTASWRELTAPTQRVSVPWFMENLVMAACDAYALGLEKHTAAGVQERLDLVARGPDMDAAIQADDAVEREHGELPGDSYSFTQESLVADPNQVG